VEKEERLKRKKLSRKHEKKKTPAVACPPAVGQLWRAGERRESYKDRIQESGVRSQNV
jgi:hypothetical protein